MNPLFSLIINNYNYGRFLRRALESALAQDDDRVELIVVDDGSTDDSRAIIAEYADRVHVVLQANGGQAAAYNTGFAVCSGEYVLFLDSDDALQPNAITRFREGFADPQVVKVQARMRLIDRDGQWLGAEEPVGHLASGRWLNKVLRYGPSAYPSTPSSASAYTRGLIAQVFPMPTAGYRVCADNYLKNISPLFGDIASIQEPIVEYRLHGSNTSYWGWRDDPRGRLLRDTSHHELACEQIARWANHLGHPCSARQWIEGRWQHLARKQLLYRLGSGAEFRVPLLVAVRAALDGSLLKRGPVLVAVAWIYFAPVKWACPLVLWLFRKKKIGGGLALPSSSSAPA